MVSKYLKVNKMDESINRLLSNFLVGLDEILLKFKDFLDTHNLDSLREASNLLNILAMIHFQRFTKVKHSVLPSSVYEASIMMNKKINEIENRGIKEEDIEYFREIYELFSFIAEKIRSGEYEKGLQDMRSNANERG